MSFATWAILPQSFSKPENHSLHPFSVCSPMLSWLQTTVAWESETGAQPQDVARGTARRCFAHRVAEGGYMDNEICDCGSNGACNSIFCAVHHHLVCYASLFHSANLVVPSLTSGGVSNTQVSLPMSHEQEHNVQIHVEIALPWWEHPHVLGKLLSRDVFFHLAFQ